MTQPRKPHPNAFTGVRRLPSGKTAAFVEGTLRYSSSDQANAAEWLDEYLYGGQEQEGPSCSICDALGHGYPGGGPCPLEETGEDDPRERELWALEDLRRERDEALALSLIQSVFPGAEPVEPEDEPDGDEQADRAADRYERNVLGQ